MFPCLAGNNQPNIRVICSKGFGQRISAFAEREPSTYFPDVLFCQFGSGIRFAARRYSSTSALILHVCAIVGPCAQKQMVGIYAAAIVAFMQAAKTVGNFAVVKFPRIAMGAYASFRASKTNDAVAFLRHSSLPNPALARFGLAHVLPKNFKGGLNWSYLVVVTSDKTNGLPCHVAELPGGLFRNWGRIATTTFAEFNWGVVRGMICHVEKLLSAFGQSLGLLAQSPGTFYWCYSCILAHPSDYGNRTLKLSDALIRDKMTAHDAARGVGGFDPKMR